MGEQAQIGFEMVLALRHLKFTIYTMDQLYSRALISERFDVKSLARSGDLESRRDWQSGSFINVLGNVHVLSPLNVCGREIELSAMRN